MKSSFVFLHTHVNRLKRKKIAKLNIYKAHIFPKLWKRFYWPTLKKKPRNLHIVRSALLMVLFCNKYQECQEGTGALDNRGWLTLGALCWGRKWGHVQSQQARKGEWGCAFQLSHPQVPVSSARGRSGIPELWGLRCSSASLPLQDVSSQNIVRHFYPRVLRTLG